MADRELDGVRRRLHERVDRGLEIFDAGQEGAFVEKSVVDGDIEAAAVSGKQSIETTGNKQAILLQPSLGFSSLEVSNANVSLRSTCKAPIVAV